MQGLILGAIPQYMDSASLCVSMVRKGLRVLVVIRKVVVWLLVEPKATATSAQHKE